MFFFNQKNVESFDERCLFYKIQFQKYLLLYSNLKE